MNKRNIELLAPAGSYEALVAGCESGADAIYLGGTKFSARASASNFDDDALLAGIRYAHVRGVKVYVTVKTLIADEELTEVLDYIDFLYRSDVDAVILQDIGLGKLIHERYPDLELHGSTQMTIHDLEGALALKEMGFSRVVVARELSLGDIRRISEGSGIQVEAFIHGALCVSWSGQCLMSSLIGGRSGNRGRCAQPCRKKYRRYQGADEIDQASYAISTRDLNTLDSIEELVESGITSLKIEGRMKSPEYVGIVVSNYRKAIEALPEFNRRIAHYELAAAFNRDFTKGYILGQHGKQIVSEDRPDNRGIYLGRVISQKENFLRIKLENSFVCDGDGIEIEGQDGYSGLIISGLNVNGNQGKRGMIGDTVEVYTGRRFEKGSLVRKTMDKELLRKAEEEYIRRNRVKILVRGELELEVGKTARFTVTDEDGFKGIAESEGPIQEAQKKAADLESVRGNLEKTGDTPFHFSEIVGHIVGSCFVPVSVLNELRRNALDELERSRSIRHASRMTTSSEVLGFNTLSRTTDRKGNAKAEKAVIIARVENLEQAQSAVEGGCRILDLKWDSILRGSQDLFGALEKLKRSGAEEIWAVLPNILKDSESGFLEELRELILAGHLRGVVAGNLGAVSWSRKQGLPYRAGSTLNVFNHVSGEIFSDAVGLQPSEELNLEQLERLSSVGSYGGRLEVKVYGRAVAMTMEYCPFEAEGCKQDCAILKGAALADNTGREFPLRRTLGHRVQLLNSSCLMYLNGIRPLIGIGFEGFILDFSNENAYDIKAIINWCIHRENEAEEDLPEVLKRLENSGEVEYTKGHFHRGVL